ncbi:hypothetical protein KKB44_02030 [Candidatus Micrarchaeota archaeon]|nr:hypothetical protein [Candidatus Micrarchaeota archaeon]
MSELTSIAGMAAGILGLAAFVPYIISTIKRKTKPNRASWWIWTFLGVIISASYYAVGATDTAWLTLSYVIGPFVIGLLSFKYGEGGWNRFDISCIIGAIFAAAMWWAFNAPIITLVLTIFIDAMGVLPTVKKAYFKPQSEDRVSWLIFFVAALLNLIAIESWIFEIAIYPVYMCIVESVVLFLLMRPQKKRSAFLFFDH